MSAVRKLFIASVLLATGLGVACLLGEPSAIRHVFRSAASATPFPALVAAPTEPKAATSLAPLGAQLLPEPATAPGTTQAAPEPPALLSSLAPVAATNEESTEHEVPLAIEDHRAATPPAAEVGLPIASLRNEAPRPLGNEPRSVAVVRRTPPVESAGGPIADMGSQPVNPAAVNGAGSPPVPAGFAENLTSGAAAVAAFNVPIANTRQSDVGPPPWPTSVGPPEPRTHVVVDGDSLERLASRYLDDPQRSREIFEFNRDILTSPDLLPIGAELKIPERVARSSWSLPGSHPAAGDTTIRSAANGNLVPIRSATAQAPDEVAAPRARLASPIAVD